MSYIGEMRAFRRTAMELEDEAAIETRKGNHFKAAELLRQANEYWAEYSGARSMAKSEVEDPPGYGDEEIDEEIDEDEDED